MLKRVSWLYLQPWQLEYERDREIALPLHQYSSSKRTQKAISVGSDAKGCPDMQIIAVFNSFYQDEMQYIRGVCTFVSVLTSQWWSRLRLLLSLRRYRLDHGPLLRHNAYRMQENGYVGSAFWKVTMAQICFRRWMHIQMECKKKSYFDFFFLKFWQHLS